MKLALPFPSAPNPSPKALALSVLAPAQSPLATYPCLRARLNFRGNSHMYFRRVNLTQFSSLTLTP
jgi:hypothetical protein